MKANLKKMLGLSALCLTMFSNTMPTWAGAVSASEVWIKRDSKSNYIYVSGTFRGTRYSADSRQFIGCSLGSNQFIQCVARDRNDTMAVCFSRAPQHAEALQAMNDYSTLSFSYFSGNNTDCNFISVNNHSSQ